jgi:hypothetical protein
VVALGDPARTELAALGINPSAAEFASSEALLDSSQRRLATVAA